MALHTADWAIFLNGTYGVGKSSTLDYVGDLFSRIEQPFALMDVDWFHRSWPAAGFDPDNVLIEARNMAAVWSNYKHAGRRQLVVSGVIASQKDLDRYADALQYRSAPCDSSPALQPSRTACGAATPLTRATRSTGTSIDTTNSPPA